MNSAHNVRAMIQDPSKIAVREFELPVNRSGDGARLLSLHGAKDFRPWHSYHDILAEHFDAIAPIHPGFGGSARAGEVETVDDLAYLYLDLIHDAGWAPVHLMGAGLGGWIAAEMAVRESAPLASLILVDALGIKVSRPETPDIVDVYAMTEEDRNARLWHDPSVGVGLVGDPKTMSEDDLETYLANEVAETLYTWKPYMHNPALRRRLHRVRVPTLVLWGADDGVVAPSYGEAFAGAIPGARFETVADAGHLPHIERPGETAGAIVRFLEQAVEA